MKKLLIPLLLSLSSYSFAQTPISALPAATSLGSTDVFPIVQGGVTKKIAASDAFVLCVGTPATGDIAYFTSATACALLTAASSTAGQLLTSAGTGAAPVYAAPVTLTSGTSRTISKMAEIIECTAACTITPPASATIGMQFCARTETNEANVITLAAVSGVQYEATARTSVYATNRKLVSGGAVTDQICMVAMTATKWYVFSSTGTWTDTAP